MKQALILAGAALAFAAAPAAAKPAHAGGHKGHKGHKVERIDRGDYRGPVYGYQQARGCPPGLAKKGNGCLPPGQAKKRLGLGSRYARDYGYRSYRYEDLPYYVRDRYFDDRPDYYDNYNYYYDEGHLYRVDPTTMIVEQIIRALIR
jgi:hypothetical protein